MRVIGGLAGSRGGVVQHRVAVSGPLQPRIQPGPARSGQAPGIPKTRRCWPSSGHLVPLCVIHPYACPSILTLLAPCRLLPAAGQQIRLKGRNLTENEHVRLGAYHTIELELHRAFTLHKVRGRALAARGRECRRQGAGQGAGLAGSQPRSRAKAVHAGCHHQQSYLHAAATSPAPALPRLPAGCVGLCGCGAGAHRLRPGRLC